ncbi:putative outer membrane protein [Streptomyces sp. V4I8]
MTTSHDPTRQEVTTVRIVRKATGTLLVGRRDAGRPADGDRDFVVKVRAAGLWEYPVGRMALRKGTTDAVRTAGRHPVSGHAALDAACRRIAPRLNITLPNRPSPRQQGFVATLSADSGKQFDGDRANILRVPTTRPRPLRRRANPR